MGRGTRAPQSVVEVTAIGGGITNTKWLVGTDGGEPLVLRWSDPLVWGAIDMRAAGPPSTPYGLLHRDFHLEDLLALTLA